MSTQGRNAPLNEGATAKEPADELFQAPATPEQRIYDCFLLLQQGPNASPEEQAKATEQADQLVTAGLKAYTENGCVKP